MSTKEEHAEPAVTIAFAEVAQENLVEQVLGMLLHAKYEKGDEDR